MAGAAFAGSRAWAAEDPWITVYPQILKRIQAPKFAAREFEITRFGAKPDGKTDCTEAFPQGDRRGQPRAGGGRVVVREGAFLTGAIHLKSNVNLVVQKDATFKFIPDPKLYPMVLTRFEGMECMNYSPFIYAFDQQNIAITGGGTLDGQASGENWWPWAGKRGAKPGDPNQRKAREALMDMAEKQCAGGAAQVRRGRLAAAHVHPTLPLHQRADRRHHDHQFAHVRDASGALQERDRAQRESLQPRAEQRRLRSGIERRRADRRLHVRYRGRLHRDQERPQRGRPAAARAQRRT